MNATGLSSASVSCLFVGFSTNVMLVSTLLHTRFLLVGQLTQVAAAVTLCDGHPKFLTQNFITGYFWSHPWTYRHIFLRAVKVRLGLKLCSRHSWLNTRLIFWRTHLRTLRVWRTRNVQSVSEELQDDEGQRYSRRKMLEKLEILQNLLVCFSAETKRSFYLIPFFYFSKRSPHSRLKKKKVLDTKYP